MNLSLIVRASIRPVTWLDIHDDIELVRCGDRFGSDGIVKGSHYSTYPIESLQQVPFLA